MSGFSPYGAAVEGGETESFVIEVETAYFALSVKTPEISLIPLCTELTLASFAPILPLQPVVAEFDLTASAPYLFAVQPDSQIYALAAFKPAVDAVANKTTIEFRHAPLVPWVMPMTQPVYPPAASGIALTPALPDITIRGLWSPSDMIFGWTFDEGTDTISIPLTSLFELTAAQADALTGDWRAVALALCNTIWDSYIELDDPPKALQLSYAPGYVQNSGVFAGHVRTKYTATAFLNFPDKSIASEP